VALDSQGNVYVTDEIDERVQSISPVGKVLGQSRVRGADLLGASDPRADLVR